MSYIGTDTTQRFLTYVGLNYPESLRSVSRFLWRRLWVRDEEIYRHTDFSDVSLFESLTYNVLCVLGGS